MEPDTAGGTNGRRHQGGEIERPAPSRSGPTPKGQRTEQAAQLLSVIRASGSTIRLVVRAPLPRRTPPRLAGGLVGGRPRAYSGARRGAGGAAHHRLQPRPAHS